MKSTFFVQPFDKTRRFSEKRTAHSTTRPFVRVRSTCHDNRPRFFQNIHLILSFFALEFRQSTAFSSDTCLVYLTWLRELWGHGRMNGGEVVERRGSCTPPDGARECYHRSSKPWQVSGNIFFFRWRPRSRMVCSSEMPRRRRTRSSSSSIRSPS